MATITGGYTCIDRPNATGYHETYSAIASGSVITANGTITNVCVYNNFGDSFSIKCKILRINGTNYDLIHTHGSWLTHTGSGAQNFAVDWSVLSGDIVAISWGGGVDNAGCDTGNDGTGEYRNGPGEITGTVAISSYPSTNRAISIYATGTTDTLPIKINIGDSWKDVDAMKINIGDSWKDVVSVKQNISDTWKTVF